MLGSFMSRLRVVVLSLMSSMVVLWVTVASAHEVLPAVGDMTKDGDVLYFEMRLSAESFVAGIDQSVVTDTNEAAQAADYDMLRALESDALETVMAEFWPTMAESIMVKVGDVALPLSYVSVDVPDVGNVEDIRTSTLRFEAALPADAEAVTFAWAPEFGTLVLRQQGVDAPYNGFLEGGTASLPINLAGGQ